MPKAIHLLLASLGFIVSVQGADLKYAPVYAPNPLKGMIAAGRHSVDFQTSMNSSIFGLREVVKAPGQYDWSRLELLLNKASERKLQSVLRPYLDWPMNRPGLPEYILAIDGASHRFDRPHFSYQTGAVVPVYDDLNVRVLMRDFIKAFGEAYDGDPRLAFVEAGLVGSWGEWIYWGYPGREFSQLHASETTQIEVMDAYAKAFTKTKILLRWPTTNNLERAFGYHDDWFGHRRGGYQSKWEGLGLPPGDRWQLFPMGGRIHPEFSPDSGRCQLTLTTSAALELADSGHYTYLKLPGKIQVANQDTLVELEHKLGYELHVKRAAFLPEQNTDPKVSITMTNTGAAPFYYSWPMELAVANKGQIRNTWQTDWDVRKVVPGRGDVVFETRLKDAGQFPKGSQLLMRMANPMKEGLPVSFANETQNADLPGWLTLAQIGD